jgi:hypothetical protein
MAQIYGESPSSQAPDHLLHVDHAGRALLRRLGPNVAIRGKAELLINDGHIEPVVSNLLLEIVDPLSIEKRAGDAELG